MIYPKKNIIFKYLLHTYVRWLNARHFQQINYNPIEVDRKRSILIIANHFSPWDTFVLHWLNRKFFKKKFHVMILEKTMIKEPMLKYGGAFSVNKTSRDMIQSLNFAARLLAEPDNMVVIFPQGKLYSNMVSEVVFEKGIVHIINKAAGKFNLVYAATFIENFQNFKVVANVYLKAAATPNFSDINQLQADYQQHYTAARQQQIQIVK
jgi:1-acyl-sn-glycerol-3-phosphate acyltransferase